MMSETRNRGPGADGLSLDMKRTSLLAPALAVRTLGLVFASGILLCGASLEPATKAIHLLQVGAGRYLAADGVSLNGKGSHRFLIDTGSNSSVFDVNAARDLRVGPTYYTRVEFLGGVATVPAARVTLCIGNICQENSEVLLTKLPAVKLADSRVRGILGMDFLTRSGFVLDNRHMELTIGRARLDYGGTMVPLERVFGRLAVRAKLTKNSDSMNLVLDSGAPCLVLFGPHRGSANAGHARRMALMTNFGSARAASVEEKLDLRLGSYVVRKLPAVVLPSEPTNDPDGGDGLIATSVFEAVVFHRSGAYALIDKAEKLRHP